MNTEYTQSLVEMSVSLAELSMKATVTEVTNKIKTIKDKN